MKITLPYVLRNLCIVTLSCLQIHSKSQGLQPLENGLEGETWTKGLDSLALNCSDYAKAGAKFAKWRATLKIQAGGPSETAVLRNSDELAQYAAICQVHVRLMHLSGACPPDACPPDASVRCMSA